ncbi:LysE family transporter [Pseudonocardia aurantiaca]|uniref:LysE family transporter n=1 Tax=Pseudonocardia aurantiaca TaxID=75290 RepID=A0ABW4FQJ8_9PSEU
MTGALVAGLLAGYGIALPVGAVATYLVALTARTSLRVGAAAAMGVATADGLYALVAVLGGLALVELIEPVAVPLRWLSAAVLVVVAARAAVTAVRGFRAGPAPTQQRPAPPGVLRAYTSLVAITVVNPTTVVYFTALVLGSQAGAAGSVAEQVVFVAAVLVASASWQLVLAFGGALLGRFLTGPVGRLATALVSSAVMVMLAVMLV